MLPIKDRGDRNDEAPRYVLISNGLDFKRVPMFFSSFFLGLATSLFVRHCVNGTTVYSIVILRKRILFFFQTFCNKNVFNLYNIFNLHLSLRQILRADMINSFYVTRAIFTI